MRWLHLSILPYIHQFYAMAPRDSNRVSVFEGLPLCKSLDLSNVIFSDPGTICTSRKKDA